MTTNKENFTLNEMVLNMWSKEFLLKVNSFVGDNFELCASSLNYTERFDNQKGKLIISALFDKGLLLGTISNFRENELTILLDYIVAVVREVGEYSNGSLWYSPSPAWEKMTLETFTMPKRIFASEKDAYSLTQTVSLFNPKLEVYGVDPIVTVEKKTY